MKKLCKTLAILLAVLSGVGAVLYLFKDKLKDTFFNSQYEDELFKLLDIGRLAWDLVRWPVDYVRALLP